MIAEPLFSVIIPLEFHRDQWVRCLRGWREQTLPKSQFELILMVPPNFTDHEKLNASAGPQIRLEYSTKSHDIDLGAEGAARARGKFLFFTESHCWPEPDVLEKCLQTFEAHPDWTAFTCKTLRVTHNRISEAEADMYEANIEYGMTAHPWRRVNDACFATYRDRFNECGGFDTQLGHFAEWVLAANYFERGYKVKYAPEIKLYHYYIGNLHELSEFSRDFTNGEMKYFSRRSNEPSRHLFDAPPAWILQGNYDRYLARLLLRIGARDMLRPHASRILRGWHSVRPIVRWLAPALAGDGLARIRAAIQLRWANTTLRVVSLIGSERHLVVQFNHFISTLIMQQRLECISEERRIRDLAADNAECESTTGWDIWAPENAGFYQTEIFQETKFRWSEPAAVVSAWMPEGHYRVTIECLPVRSLTHGAELRFFLDEQPLSAKTASIRGHLIELNITIARRSRATLAWTCLPLRTTSDQRRLGLPVKSIRWVRCPDLPPKPPSAELEAAQ
jgi:hypothetical protein